MNSRKKVRVQNKLRVAKSVSNLWRFKSVSDSKLADLKKTGFKKRTFNKMQWAVRAFKE